MTRLNASRDVLAPGALATDRRTFIQAGTAGLALLGGPLAAGRAWADGVAPVRPYKAVFDTRYGESVAFAREMTRRGVASAGLQGDVTALWYDDLYHRWKQGPTVLVGLTDASSLFCLETLANDAGMRVVLRSGYRRAADGGLERRTEGPQALADLVERLPAGAGWAPGVAGLTLACAAMASGPFARTTGAARCEAPTAAARHLTAWVIAPVKRA